MEKHCVSLEIAKQLKEAGWKKETEFWWVECSDKSWAINNTFAQNYKNKYPSPLATEILEELTNDQISEYTEKADSILDWDDTVNVFRSANALAKMWLCLKKKG